MSAPKPVPVTGEGKVSLVWFERAGLTRRPLKARVLDGRRRNKAARQARKRNRVR